MSKKSGRLKYLAVFFLLNLSVSVLPAFCSAGQENEKKTVAPAGKYILPLKKHNGYSSSFQEFRPNHFHGGIDFRTFQTTGLPVRAVTDGEVTRIRSVRRGSGLGIYLKHCDGNYSAYYHLDSFSAVLQKILLAVRKNRKNRYFGNYDLKKPLPVKAGDVIGFSGETGAGFPHLHIEIRDHQWRALNPFKMLNFKVREKNRPELLEIILRTRNTGMINGKIGDVKKKFSKQGPGQYRIAQPVAVTGAADLILATRDRADTLRPVAPYRIRASIDSGVFFDLRFDSFSWEDNNQLGFVYDMERSSSSRFFYNIFHQKKYALETRGISLAGLLERLHTGLHGVKIRVEDNFGNSSTGHFSILKINHPQISARIETDEQGRAGLVVEDIRAAGADRMDVSLVDAADRAIWKAEHHPVFSESMKIPGQTEFPGASAVVFDFSARHIPVSSERFVLEYSRPVTDWKYVVQPHVSANRAYMCFSGFPGGTGNILFRQSADPDRKWRKAFAAAEGPVFSFIPVRSVGKEHLCLLDIALVQKGRIRAVEQKNLRLVQLKPGVQAKFAWKEFSADFAANSVAESRLLLADTHEMPCTYPVISRQIGLEPGHFAFLDRVDYHFRAGIEKPQQAGIFRYVKKTGKWKYAGSDYNRRKKTFSARILVSGIFALLRDIYPPRIIRRHAGTSQKKEIRHIVLTITDRGKGVDENSLKVAVNRKKADCEYDPDRRHVKFSAAGLLKKGKNTIRAEVKDRAGNKAARRFVFYLK